MAKIDNLNRISETLNKLKTAKYKHSFKVPGLWMEKVTDNEEVNPYQYFLERINKVILLSESTENQKHELVYNMFVRLSTSYDHNGDGKINNKNGCFRETGTFLKAIAILPYIKSLGVTTIYLLPVTSIGEDGKKGNLGSPYAIKNPYLPDENLSEPNLGLDVETEFKAFAEAVHILNMKLVCEFVFRTASIDSDLSLEHPDWFYWIKANIKERKHDDISEAKYGTPIFLKKELEKIKAKIKDNDLTDLIPPHEQFIKMFTESPVKVARVEQKIRGLLTDKKTEVRIPGAFADWPPDDSQPVWSDVTYLKLYDNPKFNYIAYNTVRMYDNELAKQEFAVTELWGYISGIIPHYIDTFGIDGVMIDMGHALPSELRREIVNKALEKKHDFFFWEENFNLSIKSVNDGYSAVLGYLPFDAHIPEKMIDLLKRFNIHDIPVNFFATSETHNTPRTFSRISNIEFLKIIYTFCTFLPALSFIHSGFELGEEIPVNTGLDFLPEDFAKYSTEKLGLFSSTSLNWDNQNQITEFIRLINRLKSENISEIDDVISNSIIPITCDNTNIVSFIRRDKINQSELFISANYSSDEVSDCFLDVFSGTSKLIDLISGDEIQTNDGKFNISYTSYEIKVLKLELVKKE